MRWTTRFTVLLIFAMLSACGKGGAGGSNAQYRAAVVGAAQFSDPITVHFGADGSQEAQYLASLNGTDSSQWQSMNWSGGPPINYPGCWVTTDSNASPDELTLLSNSTFSNGISFSVGDVYNWMTSKHFLDVQKFTITYSGLADSSWGTQRAFWCPVRTQDFANALGLANGNDIHSDETFVIGHRQATNWSFENVYQMDVPGKGNVKIFAATFNYTIASVVPGLSFGTGSAQAKVYLDPDTGNWVVLQFDLSEPSGSFSQ